MPRRNRKKSLNMNAPLIFGSVAVILGGLILMGRQGEPPARAFESEPMTMKEVMTKKEAPVEKKAEVKNEKPAGPDYNSLLADAVSQGSVESVGPLLESGASINGVPSRLAPPLVTAAEMGNDDMVKELLTREANIDAVDLKGFTALHRAVQGDHMKTVKLLVENGASIQSADERSSLLVAAAEADKSMVKYLISKGADVNASARGGDTPLLAVLKAGGDDAYGKAKILVKKGAELNIKDQRGMTPLGLAEKMEHNRLVKLVTPEAEEK